MIKYEVHPFVWYKKNKKNQHSYLSFTDKREKRTKNCNCRKKTKGKKEVGKGFEIGVLSTILGIYFHFLSRKKCISLSEIEDK